MGRIGLKYVLVALLALGSLPGCGQKGPLVPPQPTAQASRSAAAI